jgi:RNA polymerase sigma factor (sigma-70 family)
MSRHLPSVTDLTIPDASPGIATVRLAAAGDQAAFARLVSEHHPSMARVAYAITGDADSAAEAVQAAWAIAWRRLGALRDHASIRAWLVAIAGNEARQSIRRRGAQVVVDISARHDLPGSGDPADRIGTLDLVRVLRTLKPDDRTLLALRFVAGLDSSEIAAQLGGSASGVRSRLSRLVDRLRLELDR